MNNKGMNKLLSCDATKTEHAHAYARVPQLVEGGSGGWWVDERRDLGEETLTVEGGRQHGGINQPSNDG